VPDADPMPQAKGAIEVIGITTVCTVSDRIIISTVSLRCNSIAVEFADPLEDLRFLVWCGQRQ